MNLDLSKLSHDPDVIRAYRDDPLVHNRMTARTYRSIIQLRDEMFVRAGEFRVPVLMCWGTADQIISIAAARLWYARVQCEKRLVTFPDCYHELHHETVRDEMLRLTGTWILADV